MSLDALATHRTTSMFSADLQSHDEALHEAISGRKILIIGGAGSIGASTFRTLLAYHPKAIHVVDQNENELAELVRQYWSSHVVDRGMELRTLPIDYGSSIMQAFVASEAPYDCVLNFAAIKHVRTEKDAFCVLQMFDTNIVKQARLIETIRTHMPHARYFSVSTDKAANPVSFMGASKRIMEHVMFHEDINGGAGGIVTSARFANVAFSNGSLLQSFENRLARYEPLACPKAIKRYFVSLTESGEICTLAAFLAPDRHIVIPRLDPESHLVDLQSIAEAFVRHHGYEPIAFEDEIEARQAFKELVAKNQWPIILTKADTAGEKAYEEFVGEHENEVEIGCHALAAVKWEAQHAKGQVKAFVDTISGLISGVTQSPVTLEGLAAILARLEPRFAKSHKSSPHMLDHHA